MRRVRTIDFSWSLLLDEDETTRQFVSKRLFQRIKYAADEEDLSVDRVADDENEGAVNI